jgi:hypothetical protein
MVDVESRFSSCQLELEERHHDYQTQPDCDRDNSCRACDPWRCCPGICSSADSHLEQLLCTRNGERFWTEQGSSQQISVHLWTNAWREKSLSALVQSLRRRAHRPEHAQVANTRFDLAATVECANESPPFPDEEQPVERPAVFSTLPHLHRIDRRLPGQHSRDIAGAFRLQLLERLDGIECRVRRQDDVAAAEQRRIARKRLGCDHV